MSRRYLIAFMTAIAALVAIAAIGVSVPAARPFREAWNATRDYDRYGFIDRVRAIRPYMRGSRTAFADIERGCLRLKFWGLPVESRSVYYELLQRRLGVQACTVGGCLVTAEGKAAWDGYNDTMMREISRRNGVKALDDLWVEADLVYRQRFERGELEWQKFARARGVSLEPAWKDPRPH